MAGKMLEINKERYEIISTEKDYWGEEGKIINKGLIIYLHKLGDKRLGMPEPTYILYFNNKTGNLEFTEKDFKKEKIKDINLEIIKL